MHRGRANILLSGMLARVPGQGGLAWVILQYLLGLRNLGHEVFFVESVPDAAIVPRGARLSESRNAAYFLQVARDFGFEKKATLLNRDTGETVGVDHAGLAAYSRSCDLLLNLSGLLPVDSLTSDIPVRAYMDLDPGFTQLWHEMGDVDLDLHDHTHHVTIGLSIGRPDCHIPTGGLDWITTPQPVCLQQWPVAHDLTHNALTTIANWRGYGSIHWQGRFYGQKAHSLRPLFGLPRKSHAAFKLALGIHPDETEDLEQLHEAGWELVDPAGVADTPEAFRSFVQESWAEFGFAKSGYVESNCGWFSDRSICYLASGRPVIAQQTGFSDYLPTGRGLLAFNGEAEVLTAIEALNEDYEGHREAARKLAEDYFDSNQVLSRLLRELGIHA